ncbi:MAG: hypothetical protein MUF42_01100 [Cytophagaceae bacterium]|nr:hypothetical protein [Cytophagaceae bacterium]
MRMLILMLGLLSFACKKKKTTEESVSEEVLYLSRFTGTTGIAITKRYSTGFEQESDVAGFYVVPSPQVVENATQETYHGLSTEHVHSGSKAHKGWFTSANPVVTGKNTNHRGYPTFQLHKTSDGVFHGLVFVECWVYLDVTLLNEDNKDWFSFATLSTYQDDEWLRTIQINLHKDGYIMLAHVPKQEEHSPNLYQRKDLPFLQKKWVKISSLIDFSTNNPYNTPYAKVWQDEVLVSESLIHPRLACNNINTQVGIRPCLSDSCLQESQVQQKETACGLSYTGGLANVHFGLYAPPALEAGAVYNDDLVMYELKRL